MSVCLSPFFPTKRCNQNELLQLLQPISSPQNLFVRTGIFNYRNNFKCRQECQCRTQQHQEVTIQLSSRLTISALFKTAAAAARRAPSQVVGSQVKLVFVQQRAGKVWGRAGVLQAAKPEGSTDNGALRSRFGVYAAAALGLALRSSPPRGYNRSGGGHLRAHDMRCPAVPQCAALL